MRIDIYFILFNWSCYRVTRWIEMFYFFKNLITLLISAKNLHKHNSFKQLFGILRVTRKACGKKLLSDLCYTNISHTMEMGKCGM